MAINIQHYIDKDISLKDSIPAHALADVLMAAGKSGFTSVESMSEQGLLVILHPDLKIADIEEEHGLNVNMGYLDGMQHEAVFMPIKSTARKLILQTPDGMVEAYLQTDKSGKLQVSAKGFTGVFKDQETHSPR